jgi:hypothetical protein
VTIVRDFADSTLWRISAYERMRAETGNSGFTRVEGNSVLPDSLRTELNRLQHGHAPAEVLAVVAACVRHRESALIMLRHHDLVWPLSLFPQRNLYHVSRPIIDVLEEGDLELQVVDVEPAGLRPPRYEAPGSPAGGPVFEPLPELLWALALNVPRVSLLEDISGRVAYRLAADFLPGARALAGALGPALRQLRTRIATLDDISRWPGMDRTRAVRLLNGVYLQGGLMVLRTHHAARETRTAGERLRGWLNLPR